MLVMTAPNLPQPSPRLIDALTRDSPAWYNSGPMKRIVALAFWVATATFAAQDLPPVGYVDVDALLTSDPSVRSADLLTETALALRTFAGELPRSNPPPPPSEELPGGVGRLDTPQPEGERDAAELELALLREALAEQIARHREYAIAEQSREQAKELTTYDEARLDDAWDWQREIGLAQRYERINLVLQLNQATGGAGQAPRLSLELASLDALSRAAAGARQQDSANDRMDYARLQAQQLRAGLQSEAAQEEREADRTIARREIELQDEATRREAYRLETLKQLGQLEVDLELTGWREALESRLAAVRERHTTLQQAYRDAADELDAKAAQRRADAAQSARPRILAWLRHIARRAGVELTLVPAADVPNVTDAVRARIAELRADPAALAPRADLEQDLP